MGGRILVVDDEPAILNGLEYLLTRAEFQVTTACTGEEALESARREPYDLVVLDIALSDLSGIELCRMLRAESIVPILIVFARTPSRTSASPSRWGPTIT